MVFAQKEKTNAHRLTRKAYEFIKSKHICGTLGPTDHPQKLTSLPGDKNWKRTNKNIRNEAVAPSESSR